MAVINLEAEQAVIGGVLLEGELIKECSLLPEHFYKQEHIVIWEAARALDKAKKPVDLVTIVTELGERIEQAGGLKYIQDLAVGVPTTTNFEYYVTAVLDAWKMRKAETQAVELINRVNAERNTDVIAETVQKLTHLDETGQQMDYNHTATLSEVYDEMENQPEGLTGIDTGYVDLNRITNGLNSSDLLIVAARPAMGKTAFVLNVGGNAAGLDKACVSIFSLEMPKKQLIRRMICAIGNIDADKMRNPKSRFSNEDWEKATRAIGIINNMNLHIYDEPGQTVQGIRARVRRLKNKYPDVPHLVIIDYLQLISYIGRAHNRNEEVAEMSRALKIMAREFELPVVALSQLSRSVEQRQDKRPMLSDLRDSGAVEQDADIIMFLYRDDYYDAQSEKKNVTEVIVGKNRHGATGTVELAFLKEYNKFVSLARG
ncbi:replicative DNA helicase [Aneurinibacillus migulanus]|uniref:replicative DNA helicase n=1 Tax=Aneurinibacillus migulanus TaxID=47500 RepID=UPI00209E6476|nr:replicative DNA helicase [Aneurinibacillus migulanus]MCP1355060.1 replicative DNA helicase [Aneurinibacillus migulanus]